MRCCWSHRWGEKSSVLCLRTMSARAAELQRPPSMSLPASRLCQPGWKRHRRPHDDAGRSNACRTCSQPVPHLSTRSSLQPSVLFPLLLSLCPLLPKRSSLPYFHHSCSSNRSTAATICRALAASTSITCLQKRMRKQSEVATAQSAQNESQTTASEQLCSGMDTRVNLYTMLFGARSMKYRSQLFAVVHQLADYVPIQSQSGSRWLDAWQAKNMMHCCGADEGFGLPSMS